MSFATFYVDADTPYHRLHPVTKIVIGFLSIPVSITATNIPFLFGVLVFYLFIWLIGRIPKAFLGRVFKYAFAFALLFLIVQPVVSAFNENWFMYPFWPTWLPDFMVFMGPCGGEMQGLCPWRLAGAGAFFVEGLGVGIAMALRLFIVMVAVPSALVTTTDIDLLLGLQKLKIPFDYAFIGTMALRYVPLINDSRHRIAEAQKLRGTDLDRANPLGKLRSLISILVPMVISSLKMTTELENAIESRAYGSGRPRTSLRTLAFTRKDKILIVTAVLAASVSVILNMALFGGIFLHMFFGINVDTTIIPPTIPNEVLMSILEFIYNLLWPLHPIFDRLGYQFNFQLPSPPVPPPTPA
ncbi:MAG: energy-coupling factor transporter transmembrane component T family protein [Candidatus Ranarchaeia archaeon]